MRFEHSPFYGSRVNQAKAQKGWLSAEEFDALGKQEFQDYLNARRGSNFLHVGQGPVRINFAWILVLLVVLSLLFK